MRVGPLSNPQIIDYINKFFVPVYVTNEYYAAGRFGESNLKLLRDVWNEAGRKNLPQGTVHVYLLTPGGSVHNSMHVKHAAKQAHLFRFLAAAVRELKTDSGSTLVKPALKAVPPPAEKHQLVLHASSQYDDAGGVVGDDWIILSRDEWSQFLPPASKSEWKIEDALAKKIFVHLYPYAADWTDDAEQVSVAQLSAYTLPPKPGDDASLIRIALRGKFVASRNQHEGRAALPVVAEIVGLVKSDSMAGPNSKPEVVLTTGLARYGDRPFSSLVTSVECSDTESADNAETEKTGTEETITEKTGSEETLSEDTSSEETATD